MWPMSSTSPQSSGSVGDGGVVGVCGGKVGWVVTALVDRLDQPGWGIKQVFAWAVLLLVICTGHYYL